MGVFEKGEEVTLGQLCKDDVFKIVGDDGYKKIKRSTKKDGLSRYRNLENTDMDTRGDSGLSDETRVVYLDTVTRRFNPTSHFGFKI